MRLGQAPANSNGAPDGVLEELRTFAELVLPIAGLVTLFFFWGRR